MNKVLNMIKQAFISVVGSDSGAYPVSQATYNSKSTDYTRLSPYGLCSNPPENSLVVLFSAQCQESVKFGIADDMPNRFKNLKSGEVVLFNYISGSYIFLKQNGDIEVEVKNNLITNVTGTNTETSALKTINADTQVNGNLTSSGGIRSDSGFNISGNDGVSGTFTSNDGKTITVTEGLITSIV